MALPIIVYFHVCCVNNWMDVVNNLLNRIHNSGLYDKITEIRIIVLGDYTTAIHLFQDPKIKIVLESMDLSLREICSIEKIYDDVINHDILNCGDYHILYIHSKGVGYNGQHHAVNDWVELLIYFNIEQHNTCIDVLNNGYDAVGVNLQDQPVLHFSGNFWWSHAGHILKLGKIVDHSYNGPEFYITKCSGARFMGLWLSGVDHYCNYYPGQCYKNMGVRPYEKIV